MDRWGLLRERSNNGWVSLGIFLDVFKNKYTGPAKHAVGRVRKQLKYKNCEVKRAEPPVGRGWPAPVARVCDLQRVYQSL